MTYSAQILCDSLAPCGKRLTTFELVFPKSLLAEFNKHGMVANSAASSRAIPTATLIERVRKAPVLPPFWGKNRPGMQATEVLDDGAGEEATREWLLARDDAVRHARRLLVLGAHKQEVNRLLDPFVFTTVVATATEWENVFFLRDHPDAQPGLAQTMRVAHRLWRESTPRPLQEGEWHLPLIREEDRDEVRRSLAPPHGLVVYGDRRPDRLVSQVDARLLRISVGRVARTSYVNHAGVRSHADDLALYDRLLAGVPKGEPGHWGPFDAPAMALSSRERHGKYLGFIPARKFWREEHRGAVLP